MSVTWFILVGLSAVLSLFAVRAEEESAWAVRPHGSGHLGKDLNADAPESRSTFRQDSPSSTLEGSCPVRPFWCGWNTKFTLMKGVEKIQEA